MRAGFQVRDVQPVRNTHRHRAFQLAGQRLRYDFYQRWMHWPQRISPTTIMPRYTKDRDKAQLASPFEGDAERQFTAIYAWLRQLEAAR